MLANLKKKKIIEYAVNDSDPLEISEIRVLHLKTLQAATEALNTYSTENNAPMVGAMMWNISVILDSQDRLSVDGLRECFKQVVSALESFYFLKTIMNSGSECCQILLKMALLNTYNQDDIVRMVSIMIIHISLKVKAIDSHYLANKATEPQMAPLNTYNQEDLVRLVNFIITYISPRVKLIDSHYLADKATCPLWNVLNNREVLLNTPYIDLNQICRRNIAMLEKISDQRGFITSSCYITIFVIINFGNVPIGAKNNPCESYRRKWQRSRGVFASGGSRCS
ncbi:hypothetical protein L5515_015633 [Caenorhabditis briggsae]|uniref:Uncharacterized protein n=1 Tax=Caenorhabditis briggsae TaxID=6238 RepID=A0AAE9EF75_CAEBR|nr:hypothetical protein L5515_015633 [Caenorhabditis briggsae]